MPTRDWHSCRASTSSPFPSPRRFVVSLLRLHGTPLVVAAGMSLAGAVLVAYRQSHDADRCAQLGSCLGTRVGPTQQGRGLRSYVIVERQVLFARACVSRAGLCVC